jgi:hypothetical protein
VTIAFPALTPSSRQITLGQYAVQRFVSIAGTGASRIYGSQPFNSSLELEFANITDADVILIVQAYETARGSYEVLSLPLTIWEGVESEMQVLLQRDYVWRFGEQPSINSVAPNTSSVSVKLDGQRDG